MVMSPCVRLTEPFSFVIGNLSTNEIDGFLFGEGHLQERCFANIISANLVNGPASDVKRSTSSEGKI